MAQSDFAEKIEIDELQIESTVVMTGDRNKNRFLYYQLKMSMLKANKIDMIVSFLLFYNTFVELFEHHYDLIYKYYIKYHSKRALGFCCSRKHAEEMAREFCKRGIETVAVYSNAEGEFSEDRDKLENRNWDECPIRN